MNKVNDFMLKLINDLVTIKEVKESTANLYVKNLYVLNNKQPFLNLSFLKNVEAVDVLLNDYTDNTKKTYLSSIVSVLSLFKDKPTYKKIYNHYFEKMMNKATEMNEVNVNVKTEKEKENWIVWDEIINIKNKFKEEVAKFQNNKFITPQQFDLLLSYVILCLYTDIPPRRNADFTHMYVIHSVKDGMDGEKNYLDWTNKNFIFNNYKTAKKYGQQIIKITSEDLINALSIYLKFHPLSPSAKLKFPKNAEFKFLVYNDGSGLVAVNSITRILNKIFDGKKIGSSMIRHIYLSTKYNIDSMIEDANAMGHSVEEQKKYMKSPNVI